MKDKPSPKPRKITVTYEEYEAILFAINDIESNIGCAEAEYVENAKPVIKKLTELVEKIINGKTI